LDRRARLLPENPSTWRSIMASYRDSTCSNFSGHGMSWKIAVR